MKKIGLYKLHNVSIKMEVSMLEIIRETKNSVNARLDMLERLISNASKNISTRSNSNNDVDDKINNIEAALYRFNVIISDIQSKISILENK